MMKKNNKQYEITFSGLKLGDHLFDFHIDDEFFENIEDSELKIGEFIVPFSTSG